MKEMESLWLDEGKRCTISVLYKDWTSTVMFHKGHDLQTFSFMELCHWEFSVKEATENIFKQKVFYN